MQIVFQLFPLAEGTLALDLFEPVLQRMNLRALVEQVVPGVLLVEFAQPGQAGLNLLDRSRKIFLLQLEGGLGARVYHQHLRPKLLE